MSAHPRLRIGAVAAAVLVLVITLGVTAGEKAGWPMLVAPLERRLSEALDRPVRLRGESGDARVTISLLPRVRVAAAEVLVEAPAWSAAPHSLRARDLVFELGYRDLLRAVRGDRIHLRELSAALLDAHAERLADGRASWSTGPATVDTRPTPQLPTFGSLRVAKGHIKAKDAISGVELDADFSLLDGDANQAGAGLTASARGTYRQQPLKLDLRAGHLLVAGAVPVTLDAQVGGARLSFIGTASPGAPLDELKGSFQLRGRSLAAVGSPVGLTLPTTGPFRAEGLITRDGARWLAKLDRFEIGSSRLAGAFVFDPRRGVPLLAGRLSGARLVLADLGPAIGLPVVATAASTDPAPAPAPASAATANDGVVATAARPRATRVLPDRPFDLPSLRAMDADVAIDIDHLDLGTRWLEPLTPLQARLVLDQGILRLNQLQARLGPGRFQGELQLDASGKRRDTAGSTTETGSEEARWSAALRWTGVRLEQWVRQPRADDDAPPYVSGALHGNLQLAGQGPSTAAILASLQGTVRTQLSAGTISHLVVEAAGLDIAQALGVAVQGDDALPVQCAVVDLVAERGVLTPRLMVLDTADSTLLMNGSISLVSEAMSLQLTVAPKDFSPLALRSPLRLTGSLADPEVSVQTTPLLARAAAAGLLALINPLAALIPLIDIGDTEQADSDAAGCRALSARIKKRAAEPAKAAKAAPTSAPPPRPSSQTRSRPGG